MVFKDDERYVRAVARRFEWVLIVDFSFSAAEQLENRVYQQDN